MKDNLNLSLQKYSIFLLCAMRLKSTLKILKKSFTDPQLFYVHKFLKH